MSFPTVCHYYLSNEYFIELRGYNGTSNDLKLVTNTNDLTSGTEGYFTDLCIRGLTSKTGYDENGNPDLSNQESLNSRVWLKTKNVKSKNTNVGTPVSYSDYLSTIEDKSFYDGSYQSGYWNNTSLENRSGSDPSPHVIGDFISNFQLIFSCVYSPPDVWDNFYTFPSLCLFNVKKSQSPEIILYDDQGQALYFSYYYELEWRLNEILFKNDSGDFVSPHHAVIVKKNGKSKIYLGNVVQNPLYIQLLYFEKVKSFVVSEASILLSVSACFAQTIQQESTCKINGKVLVRKTGPVVLDKPLLLKLALIGVLGNGSNCMPYTSNFPLLFTSYLRHEGSVFLKEPYLQGEENIILKKFECYKYNDKKYCIPLIKRTTNGQDTFVNQSSDNKKVIKSKIYSTSQQVWLSENKPQSTQLLYVSGQSYDNCTYDLDGNASCIFSVLDPSKDNTIYRRITCFLQYYSRPTGVNYDDVTEYNITYKDGGKLYLFKNNTPYLLDKAREGNYKINGSNSASVRLLLLYNSSLDINQYSNGRYNNCICFKTNFSCFGCTVDGNGENGLNGTYKGGLLESDAPQDNDHIVKTSRIALVGFLGTGINEFPRYDTSNTFAKFPNEISIPEDIFDKCYIKGSGEKFFVK